MEQHFSLEPPPICTFNLNYPYKINIILNIIAICFKNIIFFGFYVGKKIYYIRIDQKWPKKDDLLLFFKRILIKKNNFFADYRQTKAAK